jgi:hypothetical protein
MHAMAGALLRVLALSLLFAAPTFGQEAEPPSPVSHEDASRGSDSPELTGYDIYQRVLENRHQTFFQKQRLTSGDAGGSAAVTELWTRWKDGHDANGQTKRGVLSKTLAKYTAPSRVRGAGYLVVQKEDGPDDQFVYFPSARRVRRVSLSEAIMGTDYSVEDIIPRELATSEYERIADEVLDGVPCFVVDVIPKAEAGSQYAKLRSWVEKSHHVTIRTDYWDLDDQEIKRFTAPAAAIEEVEGVWLIREGTMANLVEDSSTRLEVLEMEPNAKIRDSHFSTRSLESKGR